MEYDRLIDKKNMYGILDNFHKQIQEAWRLGKNIKVAEAVDKIVIAGMGGSALPGAILKSYVKLKIPIIIVRDYSLPNFVDSKSLVFAVSYSGDTEETLNCYREAVKRKCKLIAICSGGKLLELIKENKTPHVIVPYGLEPRAAYAYQFFPMLRILENSNFINSQEAYIENLIKLVRKNDGIKELAMQLAEKLYKKIPLIYTSEKLKASGYKWKINFNENAKILAFNNVFPEFNHNEINGYINKVGEFFAIIIRDDEEQGRIKKRMAIIKDLLKKYNIPVTEILIKGEDSLTKLFSSIYIGDWTSYFLALAYKIDPTQVDIVEDLKKQLGKFVI